MSRYYTMNYYDSITGYNIKREEEKYNSRRKEYVIRSFNQREKIIIEDDGSCQYCKGEWGWDHCKYCKCHIYLINEYEITYGCCSERCKNHKFAANINIGVRDIDMMIAFYI